ncbi:hypothetical protein Q7P37_008467 [Cladosporium fusiforme]
MKSANTSSFSKFLPGQWLDTYIPTLPKAGGFTITSPPSAATPSPEPGYIELAVQKSSNPPAQYLHRPTSQLLHTPLRIRVGGSFTWPPPALTTQSIKRLVLIAGGVGINPLISIFTHLITGPAAQRPEEIHFLYGTKVPEAGFEAQAVLFLPRLMELVREAENQGKGKVTLSVFLTGTEGGENRVVRDGLPERTWERRIGNDDLVGALDGLSSDQKAGGREQTVCYVCGPQRMTDEIVEFLGAQEGMGSERVLCEKWW